MEEQFYFNQGPKRDLNLANLGVHKSEWLETSTKEYSENMHSIVAKMQDNGYDVIPAIDKFNKFSHYVLSTKLGEYAIGNTEMRKISMSDDCIYYLTHIEDAVRLMVENNRNFYFLTNHSEVIGLINIADFNNKYFYYWLYEKLVDLEQNLSKMLLFSTSLEMIYQKIKELSKPNDELGKWFKESYDRFNDNKKQNTEASITEYLYFGQLIELFKQFNLYKQLNYKNSSEFESDNSLLKEIRNTIAHPTRSLISDSKSLKDLWKGINKIDDLNKRLNLNH